MAIGVVYGLALEKVWSGQIDITTDTIRVMLVESTYTPNQDTDEFITAASADEVAGTGYTAGGEVVTGIALTYNSTTNTLMIDCDDPVWASATITGIRYAVFYKDTGTPSTSPVISYMNFETDQSVTASNFTILIPATGLISATAA